MIRPIEIKPLDSFKIWIKYSDGKDGIIDLSDLAGKGVFSAWNDYDFFKRVTIGSAGEIVWGDKIDLCPDALYLRLTKKKPEELFKSLHQEEMHA
jgi:hypothetical protein